jgi:ubiquinol-cytochrome c reductase cytochrome b subunit
MAKDSRLARTLASTGDALDDRLGVAGFAKENIKKAFPDHWSFLLGELALYSFFILILTGVFLTLFFHPSQTEIVYHGSYTPLKGARTTEAYASTLDISFDVRGGLLVRQIHHWAADLFLASICIHLMRIFFTGAFRKPREINWLIGVTLFALAIAEGFAGYSLPDDLLSGTGLRIMQGIVLSIPLVGTYLSFFIFGGQYPGESFIPRLFTVHILLIPGILLALITAHLMILWHQKHTQWPGKDGSERKVSGDPTFPVFAAKTGAMFLYTFGVLAFLGAFVQINPIWLYGQYDPAADSTGSQPDWYVGFLEGSLRIMPRLSTNVLGHTISWNVFLPAVALPIVFITGIALYPFAEKWATGDRREHNLLDRPRNAPTRTAIGIAVIAWYGDLLAAGGNDVIADKFEIPLYGTTWFFRAGFFLAPLIAFVVTRRVCLALQRRDQQTLHEGIESGIIIRTPQGGYREPTRRPTPDLAAVLETRRPEELVRPQPDHVIPLPTPGRIKAQIASRANRFYLDYHAESSGGGQGVYDQDGQDGQDGQEEEDDQEEHEDQERKESSAD